MTEYYVSTTGNDNNPGTLLYPWATPSYAVTKVLAGDTILLMDGTWYGEHISFSINGTALNPILIKSLNRRMAILDGQNIGTGIYFNNNSYIIVEGLVIKNYGSSGNDSCIQGTNSNNIRIVDNEVYSSAYNIRCQDFTNLDITDNDIHDSNYYNSVTIIAYSRMSDNINIFRNIIRDNPTLGDQIDMFAEGNIIRNITIHNNKILNANQAIFQHGAYRYENVEITNNIVSECNFGIDVEKFTGNSIVKNNTIDRCTQAGAIRKLGSSSNVIIKNNIITNSPRAIWFLPGGSVTCTYNNLYNNTENYVGIATPGIGSIYVNPQYADSTNGDFHLKSQYGRWTPTGYVVDTLSSLCIDAGDPTDDYSLEPQPNGGRIEIGAYGNTLEASLSFANLVVTTTPIFGDIYINNILKGNGSYSDNLPTGEYIVSFGNVDRYNTPLPETVNLTPITTTRVEGIYIICPNLICDFTIIEL